MDACENDRRFGMRPPADVDAADMDFAREAREDGRGGDEAVGEGILGPADLE